VSPETDRADQLLYRLMAENREHARRSEDRRIAISSITTLTCSAILITLAVLPAGLRTLPLALWLVALGILGVLSCIKLHERALFHERRARLLRRQLDARVPEAQAEQVQADAKSAHDHDHPLLSAIRFNALLVGLNVSISVLGILYVAIDVMQR